MLSPLVGQNQTHPMLQLKQPIRGSSQSDLGGFNTSNSAAKLQWQNSIAPLAKQNRREMKIDILLPAASWTDSEEDDAQKGCFRQTTGDRLQGSHKHRQGWGPFPLLRVVWGEGRAGLEGTQPLYLHKHVEDEYTRTSLILNKSVFFCLIGK